MSLNLQLGDWLAFFLQFMALSMMAVGGAITTAPDMHRYLVGEQHWLNESQFSSSIALAQAAPGPNVLFVALLGWQVGLNAGGHGLALLGALVAMMGILLPSTGLTYLAARWSHQNRERRAVRAFKQGMAPVVIALLLATAWLLIAAHNEPARDARLWLLFLASAVCVWRTRVHLLCLLGAGAVLGGMGWV